MSGHERKRSSKPALIKSLTFSLFILFGFLLLLELLLRGYFFVFNKTFPKARHLDDHLGWVTVGNIDDESAFEGYGNTVYSTTRDGFRLFGDPESEDPKLFVVGDSLTQARKVNDGETYFDYIAAHSNAEVFAYGGGGYGSLQEYMVLDKYIDRIAPDIVLWQFCGNDPHNNLFELEVNSTANNHMTRPYLEDGKVVYRYPHSSWLIRNVVRESYLLRFVGLRLDILMATHFPAINRKPRSDDPLFEQAFEVTSQILAMVKQRAADRTVLSFSACGHDSNLLNRRLADISRDNGIDYIAGVPDAVRAAQKSGVVVDGSPKDRHWNGTGSSIAGEAILRQLVDRGLLRRSADSSSLEPVPAHSNRVEKKP